MHSRITGTFAGLALLTPLPAPGIILDCDVNADGTYTCVEIHDTVVTEEARRKAKAKQLEYYEQAQTKCEYKEPRRRAVGKGSSALRMEDIKKAEKDYEACVARKAEEMRKADLEAKQ